MHSLRELFSRIEENGRTRHLLRQFNTCQCLDGKARSVRDLALKLGFDVQQCALPKGMAGRLDRDPFSENGFRIDVNESLPVESQRWAVLHEIGHWLLHVRRDDFFAESKFLDRANTAFYVDTKEEREANAVAAILLFGDGALAAAAARHGRNLPVLAKLFGVSERVMEIALRQFCPT